MNLGTGRVARSRQVGVQAGETRVTPHILPSSDRVLSPSQLALKTHPDKNPGDEDATAQFQRVSQAYNTLVKHLDRSSAPSHTHSHSHYHPFGSEEGDYYDDDDYDFEDDDLYDDYEEYEEMEFYRFVSLNECCGFSDNLTQCRSLDSCLKNF